MLKNNIENGFRNRLKDQSSPYLLQHAGNPVDWYPWGEEAFAKARAEDKPLLISIGYAACHWCHVMEHESFEDQEVADLMNRHFVCIKVDREERPDVDQVYMNAVQYMTGRGGWPLHCFTLPDGRPFYGGTYFQKETWLKLLQYLSDVFQHEKEKVILQADQILAVIGDIQTSSESPAFDRTFVDSYFKNLLELLDHQEGGTSGAPKFPMPGIWLFLLRYHRYTRNTQPLERVQLTLLKMAYGGINDQLGGGFARYSVDARWHVPHFEKMLYDNAQLISLYSEAFQHTREPLYQQVVYDTVDFVTRELTSPEGAFYSSLDADSEGEEGRFYVWKKSEIEAILKEDSALFCSYYNVTTEGNWEEGKNILHITRPPEKVAREFNISVNLLNEKLSGARAMLLAKRIERTRPGLDNKILTSWNALMIKGLTDAYRAFGDKVFLDKAQKAMNFLIDKMSVGNSGLFRNYMNGKSSIHGFLDDYAFMIDALINLYRSTFNEKWLLKADEILTYTIEHFTEANTPLFYYTDKQHHDLVVRKPEMADNVIPSSNSVMALNLYMMGKYLDRSDFKKRSEQMIATMQEHMLQFSSYHTHWATVLLNLLYSPGEMAIVGKDAESIRRQMDKHYLPDIILAGSSQPSSMPLLKDRYIENKTYIYICENNTCKLPVESVQEAITLW